MSEHEHFKNGDYSYFEERGGLDDKLFIICGCGYYEELVIARLLNDEIPLETVSIFSNLLKGNIKDGGFEKW
jgi:hypothetical protein